ncbi:hypothetical protein ABKN59_011148 [Abortiporus biennis]
MSSPPPPVPLDTRNVADLVITDEQAERLLPPAAPNPPATSSSVDIRQSHPLPATGPNDNISEGFRVPTHENIPRTPARSSAAPSSANTITSSTPLQAKPASMVSLSHFKNHIYPLLRYDLKNHTSDVSIESWVQAVLGDHAKDVNEWEDFFRRNNIRMTLDSLVEKYCNAKKEEEQYQPLCEIFNMILDIAFINKSELGLPSLPLGRIKFCRNDPNVVVRDNSQEAQRSPDIVALSQPVFEKYNKIHNDESELLQEIDRLEKDIDEYAGEISKLHAERSRQLFAEDGDPAVVSVKSRITHFQQMADVAKEDRTKSLSRLRDFRKAHKISTQSNQHTIANRGAMTQGIDWFEILGTVEVKDLKPSHARQAALAVWKQMIKQSTASSSSTILDDSAAPSVQDSYTTSSLPIDLQENSSRKSQLRSKKRALEEEAHSDQPRYGPRPKHYSSGAPLGGSLPSSQNPIRAEEQAASYALELLAGTNGTRSHCIGLVVDGEEVQFWYYDASGIIRSHVFDWFQNIEQFAAIVLVLGWLDLATWGVGTIPTLIAPVRPSPSFIPRSLEGYKLTMRHAKYEDVEVTLGKPIFSQYSLVGRRTLVYNITTAPKISDDDLVIKMSWQVCTRLSEAHILNYAVGKGVEHLPELHMWTDSNSEHCVSDPQGIRSKLFPENKRLNDEGEEEEIYEDRSLRFMVFTKYEAITLIISPSNMDYVFKQLIACLENLREILVIHRDLSITNLMHDPTRMVGKKPYFILNDFDLATFIKPDGTPAAETSSKHRTGTLPFMARDILTNPLKPHYLRHDLESALYIAFWIGASYPFGPNGQPMKRNQSLLVWEKGDFTDIATAKTNFLNPGKSDAFARIWLTIAEDFNPYVHWFLALRKVFSRASLSEMDRTEDGVDEEYLNLRLRSSVTPQPPQVPDKEDETMYGTITPAKIISALEVASLRAGLRDKVDLFVE